MCSQHEETVDHIVSGCDVLARTEYISRHNNAAAYLHWSICKDHDLKITDKWYQHTPETVIHNKDNNLTIMWDMPVNTDRTITANRPDIIVKDSVNSTCKLGKPGVVPLTLLRHTSCCGENQGRKCGILDFYYSRCVLSLLFVFVQFIYLFGAKLFVRVRIRVTYPYIKKGGPLSLVLYLLPY